MALTVLGECRPNLGSCYFHIKNAPNSEHSSVEVGEQRISVRILDAQICIFLPPSLTLVPGNISGQTSTGSTLTFRTRIKDSSFSPRLECKPSTFHPNVHVNGSTSVYCDFCGEPLTQAQEYSRVLPLPSSDEPNDFFCHRHSDEPMSLDPKPGDFFYSYFFYKMHVNNLRNPPKSSKVECPKCLEQLGEVKGKCVKLWSSVVSFSPCVRKEGSKEKFVKSLGHFVRNLPVQMNRFILKSSRGSTAHYILIWIVDRSLVILENLVEPDGDSILQQTLHLEPRKVMKVCYSHHEQLTDTAKEWMKSFNTSLVPIPACVETSFVNYLKDAADRIPAEFATVNGMSVSYMET